MHLDIAEGANPGGIPNQNFELNAKKLLSQKKLYVFLIPILENLMMQDYHSSVLFSCVKFSDPLLLDMLWPRVPWLAESWVNWLYCSYPLAPLHAQG